MDYMKMLQSELDVWNANADFKLALLKTEADIRFNELHLKLEENLTNALNQRIERLYSLVLK